MIGVDSPATAAAARPELVSKSEFARMVKRSPGAVSHWIRDQKLHGPALRRADRGEMIVVDVALQQLGIALDLGQQVAQAVPILGGPEEATLPLDEAARVARPVDPGVTDDQRRLLRSKADRSELQAQRERLDLLSNNGEWVRAADVRASWQKGLVILLTRIEAEFPTMGEALAHEIGGDPKIATLVLRRAWRELRGRLAETAAAERDALSPVLEEETVSV